MFHIWPQWGPTPDQTASFPLENQGPMGWPNFDPGAVRPHWGWNTPGWTPGAAAPPFQPLANQGMPPPRPPLGAMDPEPKPGEPQPLPSQTMFPPPTPTPNQVPGPMGPWMGPWPTPQNQWAQAPGHWPMTPNQSPWGPQPGAGGWPVAGPWGFADPLQQQQQQQPQQWPQQQPHQQSYMAPGDPAAASMMTTDQHSFHHQSQQQMPQTGAPQGADSSNANGQAFALIDEADFEQKFTDWEKQFEAWKEQNKNHPDKEAFAKYEKQWQTLREQLLQRREALRAHKAAQMAAAAPHPVAPTSAPAAPPPVQQSKDTHPSLIPSTQQAPAVVPQPAAPLQSSTATPTHPVSQPPSVTSAQATSSSAPQFSISSAPPPPPPPPSSAASAPLSTNASHPPHGPPLLPTPSSVQAVPPTSQNSNPPSFATSSTANVNTLPPTSMYPSSSSGTNSSETLSQPATAISISNPLPTTHALPPSSESLPPTTSATSEVPEGNLEKNKPGTDGIPFLECVESQPAAAEVDPAHQSNYTQASLVNKGYPATTNESTNMPPPRSDTISNAPPSQNFPGDSSSLQNLHPSQENITQPQGNLHQGLQDSLASQQVPNSQRDSYSHPPPTSNPYYNNFDNTKPPNYHPGQGEWNKSNPPNQYSDPQDPYEYSDRNLEGDYGFPSFKAGGPTPEEKKEIRNKQEKLKALEDDAPSDDGGQLFLSEKQGHYFDENQPMSSEFHRPRGRGQSFRGRGNYRQRNWQNREDDEMEDRGHSAFQPDTFHGPCNEFDGSSFPEQGGKRFPPFSERPPFPQEQPNSFPEQGLKAYPEQSSYQDGPYAHPDQRDGSFYLEKPYHDVRPYPEQRLPPSFMDDPYYRNRPPNQFPSKPEWPAQGFPPPLEEDYNEQYGAPRQQLYEERFPQNPSLPPAHHRLPSDVPPSFQPQVFEYGHRSATLVHGETFTFKHDQFDTNRNVFSYNYFKTSYPTFTAFSNSSVETIDYQHGVSNTKTEGAKEVPSEVTFPAAKSMRDTKDYSNDRRSIFSDFPSYRASSPSHRNSPRRDLIDLDDKKESSAKDKDDKSELFPSAAEMKVEPIAIKDLLVSPGRNKRPKQMVFILRGPPGSGKTSLAKLIKDKEVENGGSAPRILSLDDYFMVESEVSEIDPDTGKKVKNKDYEYEYEPEMEETYRASLYKSFKKTVDDRLFPIIIVDAINDKVKHFEHFNAYAKSRGFQVYILEMDTTDPLTCFKHNIHKRSLDDIKKIIVNWEETPLNLTRADVRSLVQDASIEDVEMEESTANDSKPKEQEDEEEEDEQEDTLPHLMLSKWEKLEKNEAKLDKLDGLSVGKRKHSSLEDYLQLPDDYEQRTVQPGKKRVRWADIEEKKEQDRLRAIGFVVGQTDWDKMMDQSQADKALTRTKYF